MHVKRRNCLAVWTRTGSSLVVHGSFQSGFIPRVQFRGISFMVLAITSERPRVFAELVADIN